MQRLSKVDSGLPMWSRCPLLCIRVGLTRIIAMLIGSKVVKVGYRVVFGGMSEVGFERLEHEVADLREARGLCAHRVVPQHCVV